MSVNLDFSRHPRGDNRREVKLFLSETAHNTLRYQSALTGHDMSVIADAVIRTLPAAPVGGDEKEQETGNRTHEPDPEDFLGD